MVLSVQSDKDGPKKKKLAGRLEATGENLDQPKPIGKAIREPKVYKKEKNPANPSDPLPLKKKLIRAGQENKGPTKLHSDQQRQLDKKALKEGSLFGSLANLLSGGTGNGLPIGLPLLGTIESPIGLGFINVGNNGMWHTCKLTCWYVNGLYNYLVSCRPDFRRPYWNFSNPITPLVIPLLAASSQCADYDPYLYCSFQLTPSPGFYCSN